MTDEELKEKRFYAAAMAAQGILANPDIDIRAANDVCQDTVYYADCLIEKIYGKARED